MNEERKNKLDEVHKLIIKARKILSEVREGEQADYDNLPKYFQDSEMGEEILDRIDALDDTDGYLDEAQSEIEQI